jgi:hypothetical protein
MIAGLVHASAVWFLLPIAIASGSHSVPVGPADRRIDTDVPGDQARGGCTGPMLGRYLGADALALTIGQITSGDEVPAYPDFGGAGMPGTS